MLRPRTISVDKNFKQKFSFCPAFVAFLLLPILARPFGEVHLRTRPVLQSSTGKESCMFLPV
jgi:hypothetical protein